MTTSSPSTLAKLTSISTLTLSLLLERQRAMGMGLGSPSPSASSTQSHPMHLSQITKNLTRLREGILEMERTEGRTEASRLLRGQFERMRGMLGEGVGGVGVGRLDEEGEREVEVVAPKPVVGVKPGVLSGEGEGEVYRPYRDDPVSEGDAGGEDENGILLTQRRMMDEQDHHLDRLSHSLTRQHHISLQINDELDVHHGLLEEFDTDLDRTGTRLARARGGLARVARGVKGNGSTVAIGVLIFVLLVLIIVFKT